METTTPTTTTKLPDPPVQREERNVKIRLLRDSEVHGSIMKAGTEVMVTENVAKLLCEKFAPGYVPCYGAVPEIGGLMEGAPNPLELKKIYKAVRVA